MAPKQTARHNNKKKRLKEMRLVVPALLKEYGNRDSLLTLFLRVPIDKKV
jgi:hypothetical protein